MTLTDGALIRSDTWEGKKRAADPGLSDNQWIGVEVMRIYAWIAVVVVLGGLALWGWWYRQRRAWPTHEHDEAMRRHVNRNYD